MSYKVIRLHLITKKSKKKKKKKKKIDETELNLTLLCLYYLVSL